MNRDASGDQLATWSYNAHTVDVSGPARARSPAGGRVQASFRPIASFHRVATFVSSRRSAVWSEPKCGRAGIESVPFAARLMTSAGRTSEGHSGHNSGFRPWQPPFRRDAGSLAMATAATTSSLWTLRIEEARPPSVPIFYSQDDYGAKWRHKMLDKDQRPGQEFMVAAINGDANPTSWPSAAAA